MLFAWRNDEASCTCGCVEYREQLVILDPRSAWKMLEDIKEIKFHCHWCTGMFSDFDTLYKHQINSCNPTEESEVMSQVVPNSQGLNALLAAIDDNKSQSESIVEKGDVDMSDNDILADIVSDLVTAADNLAKVVREGVGDSVESSPSIVDIDTQLVLNVLEKRTSSEAGNTSSDDYISQLNSSVLERELSKCDTLTEHISSPVSKHGISSNHSTPLTYNSFDTKVDEDEDMDDLILELSHQRSNTSLVAGDNSDQFQISLDEERNASRYTKLLKSYQMVLEEVKTYKNREKELNQQIEDMQLKINDQHQELLGLRNGHENTRVIMQARIDDQHKMICEFQKQEEVTQDTLKAAQETLKEAEKHFKVLEEQNQVLQEDREYLRTENTKVKKQMKQLRANNENSDDRISEKRERMNEKEETIQEDEHDKTDQTCSSNHSINESECCCCSTTVRGLSKLQKFVRDEFAAHNQITANPSAPSTNATDSSVEEDGTEGSNNDTDNTEQTPPSAQPHGTLQHRPGNSSYAEMTERGKKIAVLSDSMCKHIDVKGLNRVLENKEAYKKIFLGATAADINFYSLRTLVTDRPDIGVIHAGTNNIGKDDPFNIAKEITEIVNTFKIHGCCKVFVSGIIDRPDFSEDVQMLNNILYQWSFLHDYTFIHNDNIRYDCLARDDLHVNYKGAKRLTANFRRALCKPYV